MATSATTSNNIYEDNVYPVMSDADIRNVICVKKQKPTEALLDKLKEINEKLKTMNQKL